jgi:hypothetical protein
MTDKTKTENKKPEPVKILPVSLYKEDMDILNSLVREKFPEISNYSDAIRYIIDNYKQGA